MLNPVTRYYLNFVWQSFGIQNVDGLSNFLVHLKAYIVFIHVSPYSHFHRENPFLFPLIRLISHNIPFHYSQQNGFLPIFLVDNDYNVWYPAWCFTTVHQREQGKIDNQSSQFFPEPYSRCRTMWFYRIDKRFCWLFKLIVAFLALQPSAVGLKLLSKTQCIMYSAVTSL